MFFIDLLSNNLETKRINQKRHYVCKNLLCGMLEVTISTDTECSFVKFPNIFFSCTVQSKPSFCFRRQYFFILWNLTFLSLSKRVKLFYSVILYSYEEFVPVIPLIFHPSSNSENIKQAYYYKHLHSSPYSWG